MGENAEGPDTVTCPTCETEVTMGLPRSARIEAVTTGPDENLESTFLSDGSRHKRRKNRCSRGHTLYVYFAF